LTVSPNPTHGKVEVRYRSQSAEPITMQLFSINNKRLYQETKAAGSDEIFRKELDFSRFSPGVYIISVHQGSTVVSRRIIRY
jgi:hypothetical protein